jgi:hypothetical protein
MEEFDGVPSILRMSRRVLAMIYIQALKDAYNRHPERFSKRGPKLLIPQDKVGINIPVTRQSMFVLG